MGVANISGNILNDTGASLSSYLPLTGGTLTGALNGTSATFSSSVTATQLNATTTAAGYAAIFTNTNGASDSNGLLVKAGSTASEYVVRFAPQSDASTFFTVKGNGNVGIGTSSPGSKLQVEGGELRVTTSNAGVAAYYTAGNGELAAYNWGGAAWIPLSYAGQYHIWRNSGNEVMRITSGGNVEIANGYLSTSAGSGTSYCGKLSTVYTYPYIDTYLDSIAGASYQSRLRFRLNTAAGSMEDKLILWYNGSVTFSGLAGSGTRTVTALSDGTLSTSSDSRLKQEDKEYTIAGLKELLQITPKAYKWLSDIEQRGEDAQTELGFFADEVAPIIPSAAPKGQDDMYGFYDRALMAVMVKAIQELNAKVTALENK